jgi:hypothetical protein
MRRAHQAWRESLRGVTIAGLVRAQPRTVRESIRAGFEQRAGAAA